MKKSFKMTALALAAVMTCSVALTGCGGAEKAPAEDAEGKDGIISGAF